MKKDLKKIFFNLVVTKMWNPQNGIHWNLNAILWNAELPKMWSLGLGLELRLGLSLGLGLRDKN